MPHKAVIYILSIALITGFYFSGTRQQPFHLKYSFISGPRVLIDMYQCVLCMYILRSMCSNFVSLL